MRSNAISNQSGELTIDPGASGDSFIQFDINATGEFRIGVDDSDSDAFVVSQGSALGTNNTMIISASGEITEPLQPAFLGWPDIADSATGDGTVYTVVVNNEIFDQGGDFNTGTYTFTSPVTGVYRLTYVEWVRGNGNTALSSSHTSGYTQIVTSNRTYRGAVNNPYVRQNTQIANGQQANNLIVMADMDSGDTAYVTATVSGGTKTVGIGSVSSTDMRGFFCGSLVC